MSESTIEIKGYADHPYKFDGIEKIFRGCVEAEFEFPEFLKDYINKIDLVTYDDNKDRVYESPANIAADLAKNGKVDEAFKMIEGSNVLSNRLFMDSNVIRKHYVDDSDSAVDYIIDMEALKEKASKIKFVKVRYNKPEEHNRCARCRNCCCSDDD